MVYSLGHTIFLKQTLVLGIPPQAYVPPQAYPQAGYAPQMPYQGGYPGAM